jgi:uncharacterized protein YxeA
MKKILIAIVSMLFLSSCGVGTYSISSGKADMSELSFVDTESYNIDVVVDKTQEYGVSTVKEKAYKPGRNIKYTALNTISLSPGKHQIEVRVNGKVVYSQLIFVSTGEHKIIEL